MTNWKDVLTLDLVHHRSTLGDRGALLVSHDGNEKHAVWLPKMAVGEMVKIDRTFAGPVMRMTVVRDVLVAKGLLTAPAADGPGFFDEGEAK